MDTLLASQDSLLFILIASGTLALFLPPVFFWALSFRDKTHGASYGFNPETDLPYKAPPRLIIRPPHPPRRTHKHAA